MISKDGEPERRKLGKRQLTVSKRKRVAILMTAFGKI